jgi:putative protease
MSIEILAPAGGREHLVAAVRSGADAVYLGTGVFNARRNAENFGEQDLEEAVKYCHARDVKVYVTLNTLVKDRELPLVYEEIKTVAACGADAVIVQDMAVAEMLFRHCPSMPVHASTQMAIHNLAGALKLKEMGFKRIVLARELTAREIKKISSDTGMEIEIFVHGALCMSVSGMCYLSSILGERSGNRGLCAQPCRLYFRNGDKRYALSLKDMSYIDHIGQLIDLGVCSLKIEGRMKRPEYVSAAVLACKSAVKGEKADLSTLRAVFSRSGFTDGYITGKRGPEMFGHRTREDVEASMSVLGRLREGYRNELPRIPVEMRIRIRSDEPSLLKVSDGRLEAVVSGDVPEKAIKIGVDEKYVLGSLEKTGGTPFYLEKLETELDNSLMLARSSLNSLRRNALEKLLELRGRTEPKAFSGDPVVHTPAVRKKLPVKRIRFENKNQIFRDAEKADRIYLPIGQIDDEIIERWGKKLICELPRLVYPPGEKALYNRLEELKAKGIKSVCAGNLGTVAIALELGLEVHGGFDLNILNSESFLKYQDMGFVDAMLSMEINLGDASRLAGDMVRGIIGYGYLPLMVFRNCPIKTGKSCGSCSGIADIKDRKGTDFKILCSNREYSSLLNAVPLYMGDKDVSGVDFITVYYTVEDSKECRAVWDIYYRQLK